MRREPRNGPAHSHRRGLRRRDLLSMLLVLAVVLLVGVSRTLRPAFHSRSEPPPTPAMAATPRAEDGYWQQSGRSRQPPRVHDEPCYRFEFSDGSGSATIGIATAPDGCGFPARVWRYNLTWEEPPSILIPGSSVRSATGVADAGSLPNYDANGVVAISLSTVDFLRNVGSNVGKPSEVLEWQVPAGRSKQTMVVEFLVGSSGVVATYRYEYRFVGNISTPTTGGADGPR